MDPKPKMVKASARRAEAGDAQRFTLRMLAIRAMPCLKQLEQHLKNEYLVLTEVRSFLRRLLCKHTSAKSHALAEDDK